jgi:hypothetical protein
MNIKTLTAISVLLIGVAACNNPKAADPASTSPAVDATIPPTDPAAATNAVEAPVEASNAVTEPTSPPPQDEPRGNEDRRSGTTTGGGTK